jgi:hypothetical protein
MMYQKKLGEIFSDWENRMRKRDDQKGNHQ